MKMFRLFTLVFLFILAIGCNVPTPGSTLPPESQPSPTPPQPTSTLPDALSGKADIIFTNGAILTMDEANPIAQAVAVQGEKILAVGANEDILAMRGETTRMIDLGGRTMTPGFIDSHSHRITQRYKWGFSTVEQAIQEALSQGWTEVTELAVDENQFNELREAASQGQLHARVNVHLLANTFEGESLGDWYKKYKSGQMFGPYLRIAGLKIFIDYDSGRTLFFRQDELNELVRQLQAEGWTISVKAIGIQSHELALNAYEYALNGESNALHRHRIEHSIAASDDQVTRMARLGIIVCIQPSLPAVAAFDLDVIRMRAENGANNSYRWSDYQKAGVFLIASPLNPYPDVEEHRSATHISPMGLLYRSVTQIGVGNQQPEAWMLEKSLSVEQILPMLTIHGAYAAFAEDARGSLTAGKYADLVILSGNPLKVEAERLKDIQALMTMVAGKVEYCAAGYESLCGSSAILDPGAITATASASQPDHEARLAVDGSLNTYWNSGGLPEQWILLDLGNPISIRGIRLFAGQYPNGETLLQFWMGPALDRLTLEHEYRGFTREFTELEIPLTPVRTGIRYIKIVSMKGASWVAWREIQIIE